MSLDGDLSALADQIAACRMYRMALHARALHHQDRNRDLAVLLAYGADVAGQMADEYAEVCLYRWATRDARAA